MNPFAAMPASPPSTGEARQPLALPAVEGMVTGAKGRRIEVLEQRTCRPPAPPALSRSPILYLMSLRWAAGRRWRPAMRNGRK
jgi:hypothetical protein